tara:strand:+ start:202 stop:594 length:393 start_codon:yes stop_codon:yes gene_type:complete
MARQVRKILNPKQGKIMKTETKDQLRAKIEKLEGQVKNLKDQGRDKFTVTMNKDQLTLLMDKLRRSLGDMDQAMQIAEEDHSFDGFPNIVLLQGWCEMRSLYDDLKRQTGTSWDFDVATQKLFMSEEGKL